MQKNYKQQTTLQLKNMCRPSTKDLRRPRSGNRAGSEVQFPGKLHDMMTFVEREGLESIISWVRNGSALMVHNPEKLVELLPLFFSQTKYRSFQRQLNMWHFQRVLDGPDRGAFVHPYFIRGNKPLCAYMSRHGLNLPDPHHLSQTQPSSDLPMTVSSFECALKSSDMFSYEADTNSGCDLKDGDLSMFAGRTFYFVDPMISNSSKAHTEEQENKHSTEQPYDLTSVFRDLKERKRLLLQKTRQSVRKEKTLELDEQLSIDTTCFSLY